VLVGEVQGGQDVGETGPLSRNARRAGRDGEQVAAASLAKAGRIVAASHYHWAAYTKCAAGRFSHCVIAMASVILTAKRAVRKPVS
jgi:hypothetical protein